MTSPVWARARTELCLRWRATVALAVLVGLVGGVALFGVAAYRRTASAMDRFLAYSRPNDVYVAGDDLDLAAVEALPQVAGADSLAYFLMAPSTPGGEPDLALGINPISSARGHTLRWSDRPLLLQGRLPNPDTPFDVAVNQTLAEDRNLAPGDTLRMFPYTTEQLLPLLEGSGAFGSLVPDGQPLDLTVTAVVRHPADVSPNPTDDEVVYLSTRNLFLTPAFHHRYLDELANFNQLVGDSRELRLHRGPDDLPAFVDAVRALPGGESAEIDSEVQSRRSATDAQRAIDLQAGAVLAFALLVALAGTLVVGQALARQVALDGGDHATLRALGMTSGQLAGILALRVALIGIAAVPLAVVLAIALSPLGPLGLARAAEVDPGVALDGPVLGLGALALVAAVVARATPSIWRVATAPHADASVAGRPRSWSTARLARAGAPPTALTGVGMALAGGSGGGAAVPLRSALGGAALAVGAIAGALSLAASLDHLLATPRLQGWNWDVVVGDGNTDNREKGEELLPANPFVEGFTAVSLPVPVDIGGVASTAIGLDQLQGDVGPEVTHGRLPARAGEVAVGPVTAEQLGLEVGDWVDVDPGTGVPSSMTVVGRAYLGHDALDYLSSLGDGVVLTHGGMEALAGEVQTASLLVDYAEGADSDRAFAALQADWGRTVLRPLPPVPVENLRRLRGLPLAFAATVALLAVATLGHTLVTSVRRNRRDLATLKAIGFVRRQVATTVAWQATTLAAVALVVGLPLGVAAGRWGWRLVAEAIGTPAVAVTPLVAVLGAIPLTLLLANTLAAVPARRAAHVRPTTALRAE